VKKVKATLSKEEIKFRSSMSDFVAGDTSASYKTSGIGLKLFLLSNLKLFSTPMENKSKRYDAAFVHTLASKTAFYLFQQRRSVKYSSSP
jgi:hypothetical protein